MNGGPGCSSTTGLLFELGPCSIQNKKGKGADTKYNPYSWTEHANVLFLDQPVGVGYSYSDEGGVDNSPAAAVDVLAFLQLFIANFGKYRNNEFHISGESYAGTYLPNIAHVIHAANKKQDAAPETSSSASVAPLPKLNFKSVLIGNGLSDPAAQFASVPEYACDSKYAVYDDPKGPECQSLRTKMERCEKLANACYKLVQRFLLPRLCVCFSSDTHTFLISPHIACKTSLFVSPPLLPVGLDSVNFKILV